MESPVMSILVICLLIFGGFVALLTLLMPYYVWMIYREAREMRMALEHLCKLWRK